MALRQTTPFTNTPRVIPLGAAHRSTTPFDQSKLVDLSKIPAYQNPRSPEYIPPPPQPLATNANVNAAYKALMQGQMNADEDRGTLRRNLDNTLMQSKKNRLKAIAQGHQSFADRGILNSGIALGHDTETDTAFDQLDRGYNDSYDQNIRDIARKILGLNTAYEDSQVQAAHDMEVERANQEAAALKARQDAEEAQKQQAALLAQLAPAMTNYNTPGIPSTPESPIWTPAPAPYIPPKPKPAAKPAPAPKPKPASGTTGKLVLKKSGVQ